MDDSSNLFSDGELALIVGGVSDNFRIDGRSCFDIRNTRVRSGVISSCNGSAQVESTNCNITVGIKLEVGQPAPDEPDCGIVEFNVDSCWRVEDELSQEIVSVLTNALIPSIDRKTLCISEGHKVWIVYIDVLVIEYSCFSQLLDLAALGIKAALHNTRVPRLIADEEDANDFVLSPDQEEYSPVAANDLPILLTLTRIHDQYVADVTEEEAAAGIARLTMAFDSRGQLSYTKKTGCGSLHPDPLKEVLGRASRLAMSMHANLNKQLVAQ